jgi:hypothetical protein
MIMTMSQASSLPAMPGLVLSGSSAARSVLLQPFQNPAGGALDVLQLCSTCCWTLIINHLRRMAVSQTAAMFRPGDPGVSIPRPPHKLR